MSFRDFKFPAVVTDLGLTLRQSPLFAGVRSHAITDHLRSRLTDGLLLSRSEERRVGKEC